MTVQVEPVFLMYAFRYALGRMTYVVSDVADALIAHRDALQPTWRQQIIEEITRAIAENRAGMPMDVDRWRSVLTSMSTYQDRDPGGT